MAMHLKEQSFRMRVARLLLVGSAVALAGVAGRVQASHLSCGQSLGAGVHVMDSDLVCPLGTPFALELTTGAELRMWGHSITYAVGGAGEGIKMSGTGAHVWGGRIHGTGIGIHVHGGGHRIAAMSIEQNNLGIYLDGSDDNVVVLSSVSKNYGLGIFLRDANRNRLAGLKVNDQWGTALVGGIELSGSDENSIVSSQISRNFCVGIYVGGSSKNTIRFNLVDDNQCGNRPAVNIALFGASTGNVIRNNSVSSSAPGKADDGINVGCKDECGYQGPTTGANNNVVTDNLARNNDRYGIAQSTGNTGNVYVPNVATGNRVADYAIDP